MAAEPETPSPVPAEVEELIRGPQYALPQAEKERRLLPLIARSCREMAERCPPYARFLDRLGGGVEDWASLIEIPPLPVTMFKHFLLSAVPPDKVVRELHSSATTSQHPSRIVLDKTTGFRQARALASILKEHIGGQRRPFLVLDAAQAMQDGDALTARGAAIRGIGNFAANTTFAMRRLPSGDLAPDWEAIDGFLTTYAGEPVLIFGFTFMVWTRFVLEAERRKTSFGATQAFLLHSGGWKKLAAQAVSKDKFGARAAAVLGCAPSRILDFYGMVEQVGTVFVDCAAGNKHAPAFADVLLRRPLTLAPVHSGETGIIEVLSALPSSYPGHALITEDQGVLVGEDDCPCGSRGRYFRFTGRVERTELRGCGDTFAQSREAR
jgi:hypothetical protein